MKSSRIAQIIFLRRFSEPKSHLSLPNYVVTMAVTSGEMHRASWAWEWSSNKHDLREFPAGSPSSQLEIVVEAWTNPPS